MAAPPPPPSKGGGMSLYANLLDAKTDASTSISKAPVMFMQAGGSGQGTEESSTPQKPVDSAALRFQPIRRPQAPKPKTSKPAFPRVIPGAGNAAQQQPSISRNTAAAAAAASPTPGSLPGGAPGSVPSRSTLADWAATEDDAYLYSTGEKRQRGGRKKRNKRKNDMPAETDWDELYDPARPTNVDEYLRSDERIREVREWKAVLYAHRRSRRRSTSADSDISEEEGRERPVMNAFAPPANYSFAPPPQSPPRGGPSPQPQPRVAPPPDDATGDDAYTRRLALSSGIPPPPRAATPPPPPPPPPPTDSASISRAPVRYEQPPEPEQAPDAMDIDDEEGPGAPDDDDDNDNDGAEEARTNRPGQAGFAQRLMAKYGWSKGTGLGADESGIVNPLRVQVEKRRKRPDAEGGGYAEPGSRGKILGGNRRKPAAGGEEGGSKFGKMSEVIVLRNMLEGMPDLAAEVEQGLGQEIGEECGEKYGRVERLYIEMVQRQVFIKFTEQISALRAVNALEGRVFNGNTIVAKFYDIESFEGGDYDK